MKEITRKMQKLKILNTREVKKILEKLKKQFSFAEKLDYVVLLNEKGRLFIVNKDISKVDLKKLKVDKYGLYFGELRNEEIRLSMEGAKIIGEKAKKNVVELGVEEVRRYFLGDNLKKDLGEEKRFVLLEFKKNIIGCAKYKSGEILNFLPKIHRGEVIL